MEIRQAGTISEAQRRAFVKAAHIRGFDLVERVRYGVYRVHSATRAELAHTVLGTDWYGTDHTCTCEAAAAGKPWCWHRAAVVLARQQHAYRQAKAKAATRAAPAPTAIRHSVGTIRIGGVEFIAEGRNVLDAIARAAERAHAAGQQQRAA